MDEHGLKPRAVIWDVTFHTMALFLDGNVHLDPFISMFAGIPWHFRLNKDAITRRN